MNDENTNYIISYTSKDASSTNVNLDIGVCVSEDSHLYYYKFSQPIFQEFDISFNNPFDATVLADSLLKYNYVGFWVKGFYWNKVGTKKFYYSEFVVFNNKNKKSHYLLGSDKKKIAEFMKQYEK